VVNTNFYADVDADGDLRIWVNDALKCHYHGRLVADPAAKMDDTGPSHRRSIFAGCLQRRTRTQGAAPKPTTIVHCDEFRVGHTRKDARPRPREAAGLPPVD
jgi:hypothetical protein